MAWEVRLRRPEPSAPVQEELPWTPPGECAIHPGPEGLRTGPGRRSGEEKWESEQPCRSPMAGQGAKDFPERLRQPDWPGLEKWTFAPAGARWELTGAWSARPVSGSGQPHRMIHPDRRNRRDQPGRPRTESLHPKVVRSSVAPHRASSRRRPGPRPDQNRSSTEDRCQPGRWPGCVRRRGCPHHDQASGAPGWGNFQVPSIRYLYPHFHDGRDAAGSRERPPA